MAGPALGYSLVLPQLERSWFVRDGPCLLNEAVLAQLAFKKMLTRSVTLFFVRKGAYSPLRNAA